MPRGLRIAPAALICLYVALIGATWINRGQPWFIGDDGRPTAQDFLAFRLAATMALEGRAEAAYHLPTLTAGLQAATGNPGPFWLNWPYPPPLTLLLVPFALLPYAVSWFVWILATGSCLVVAMRSSPLLRHGVGVVLASPASVAIVLKGQASFLTAALFTGFLAMMDRRPWIAGACLGLMTYKPHLGVLIPIFLLTMRRWDIILSAAVTTVAFAAVSAVVFGARVWIAFWTSVLDVAESFMTPDTALPAMQTVYAGVTMAWGERPAMLLHGAVALGALLLTIWILRSGADAGARSAAIIAASLLAPPYGFQHDQVLLAVACVFLLGSPTPLRLSGDVPLLMVALLLPGVTLFTVTAWPGPLSATLILALAARRASVATAPGDTYPDGARSDRAA